MIYSEYIHLLQTMRENNSCPHMLIESDSYDTLLECISSFIQVFYPTKGKQMVDLKERILFLDCLEYNNIQHMREVLQHWIKNSFYYNIKEGDGFFRTIIFYNANYLSVDTQSALRRIIEIYSTHNRFIMATLNKSTIIKPIQSRLVYQYVINGEKHREMDDNNDGDDIKFFTFSQIKELVNGIILGKQNETNILESYEKVIKREIIDRYFKTLSLTDFITLYKSVSDEVSDIEIIKKYMNYMTKIQKINSSNDMEALNKYVLYILSS